jgi:hypothetical protein
MGFGELFITTPPEVDIRDGIAHITFRSSDAEFRICMSISSFGSSIEECRRQISRWRSKQAKIIRLDSGARD